MSLHCVPYILYWIQAEWKFYIRTYCQIIWVNFTNMAAIIFFPSGCPHLANHPPYPCPHLSTFARPPPSNVWTSFMDGPKVKRPSWSRDLARSHDKLKPLCLYYRRPMATKLRRMWTYFKGLLFQVKLWSSGLARSRDKQNHYISITRLTIKLGRIVTYADTLLPIKSHHTLITWFCEITWQTKFIISLLP